VQTYRKTVQHLEGGIVKDVLAHDGDIVKKGDPLIILDDAQLRSEYEMTRNQLIAAKAMEARLIAERDDKSVITFDQMYEPESPRGIEARAGETEVFNARRGARLGQIAVLQERIGQLNQQIKGTDTIIGTKQNLEQSYTGEIGDLNELLAQGFVDKQRMLEQQRKLDMQIRKLQIIALPLPRLACRSMKRNCRYCKSTRISTPTWLQLSEIQTRLMTCRAYGSTGRSPESHHHPRSG
jgi:epimerase transport system membrane fusion protein